MKIDEKTKEKILNLHATNVTQKKIAENLGISLYQVQKALGKLKSNKIKTSNIKVPNEKEQKIINLYKSGKSQKEIADLFGTYNTSIRRILLRFGIQLRDNSKVQKLCKHNPFKNNDEYSDYFLGLLLTDGTITKTKSSTRNYNIVLSLNEEDKYLVEEFRNWASPKSKVSKVLQKINNSYMHSISFTNKEAEDWLRRAGNFWRKSYECKIYKKLNWNILRGIFDGDGGFHQNGKHLDFFICGASKIFMIQVMNFLNKNGLEAHFRTITKNNKEFYYVELYKISDVINLGLNMYNNPKIYMKRKFNKWLAFYESKKANTLNSGKETDSNPEPNLITLIGNN